MLVQCEHEPLRKALAACLRLGLTDPLLPGVTLSAVVPPCGATGTLLVTCESPRCALGVRATLPALVALPGQLTVPFQPVTALIATWRSGMVQLAHGQVTAANALPPMREGGCSSFASGSVLILEQETTSQRGTRATHVARVRLTDTAGEALPPPPAWGETPDTPIATVSAAHWREALAPCLLLTKEHAVATEPDRDHRLVLMRFAPDRLQATAATRVALVSRQLPFLQAHAPAPVLHILVPGHALAWICRSLTETHETGPLTLALAPEQDRLLLLVSTTTLTFWCVASTTSIPLVWERGLRLPATVDLLVARAELKQALQFLAAARRDPTWKGVIRLQVEHQNLVLQWITGTDRVAGQREIALLQEARDTAPVWVNLTQCRRLLALLSGSVLSLQLGPAAQEELGFLRLSTPADLTSMLMMSLSTLTTDAVVPPPVEARQAAKGGVLAPT